MGLAATASEQLAMFRQFDRDDNGRVGWEEFRTFGAALLELVEEHAAAGTHGARAAAARHAQTPPRLDRLGTPTSAAAGAASSARRPPAGTGTGGTGGLGGTGGIGGAFARRGAAEEQRVHRAAGRIQVR